MSVEVDGGVGVVVDIIAVVVSWDDCSVAFEAIIRLLNVVVPFNEGIF